MTEEARKMRLLLKDCAAGFYQQMYFLGKDVSHPSGNKLIEYGFKKSPSLGLTGTSCYTFKSGSEVVELYGSCAALYANETKIVFLRERCRFYQWIPEHHLVAGNWSQEDLKIESFQCVFNALTPLLQWWMEYEKWVEQKLGSAYRKQCYKDWKKLKSKPAWLAPDVAVDWVIKFLKLQEKHVRPKHFV